jgi:rhodanese-related sulfurtransferase
MVDQVIPVEAFEILKSTTSSAMVDVRTRAEWAFTGMPDVRETKRPIWPVEWVSFPGMSQNAAFMDQLLECADGALPQRLLFICRSGARSMSAAQHVAAAATDHPVQCTNVAEGFEGDLDADGHRSVLNGWKVRGLPWRQS